MIKVLVASSCVFTSILTFAQETEKPLTSEVYFSPKDHLCRQLISHIDQEEESLQIAIYNLTHREIKEALIRAKGRGVGIEVIVDEGYKKYPALVNDLMQESIPIFVYNPKSSSKNRRPLMHHKFCLFGKQKKVWTGSFNFTYKADRENRENAVVLSEDDVFSRFHSEFEHLKGESTRIHEKR